MPSPSQLQYYEYIRTHPPPPQKKKKKKKQQIPALHCTDLMQGTFPVTHTLEPLSITGWTNLTYKAALWLFGNPLHFKVGTQ